jgi:ankyrin repeat protein
MKIPSLPGWRRSSHAAETPGPSPVHRQGTPAALPPGLVSRTHRSAASVGGPGAAPVRSAPQPPQQDRPVRSTATLNKLANLSARRKPAGTQPAPSPAGPPGDGWGMTFLRKGDRQALFKLAGDPDAALPDVMNLLSRSPGLDLAGDDGKSALLCAVRAKNGAVVQVLAERGADVHATEVHAADVHGLTALHLAAMPAEEGRVQPMISALLAAGADVHAQNVFGMTPLSSAASKAAVDLLLDAGAAIDHCSRSGNTPLLYAAKTWRPAAMRALLERGADPQATNEEGVSVIDLVRDHYGLRAGASLPRQPAALAHYIARREAAPLEALFHLADHPNVALPDAMKLSCASELDVPGYDGRAVLLHAAGTQNAKMVKVLVDHGANVHVADANGLTALHLAAASSKDGRVQPMVSGLLAAGAHVDAQNVVGMTPLFMAASKAAVDLLLDAGAAIEHRDRLGNTALTHAAMIPKWKPHAMVALLERGADPGGTNSAGHSFIDMVRDHYDLDDEDDTLPLEPQALAAYIALREVAPPQRLPTAPRVPAPAVVVAPKTPINSLPSGYKIDLVDRPHARIDDLEGRDLNALSLALGFGPLLPLAEERDAQVTSILKTLDAFTDDVFDDFADHDNKLLEHPGLLSGLSAAEQQELKAAMDIAHMSVAAPRDLRGRVIMPCEMKIFFNGSRNLRDLGHDIRSGFGQTSSVDRAARRIGELLAKQIKRNDNQIRIERIAGASMGGASAQTLLAALQSRRLLDRQPSMLLLDPQLLNNRQAARATRDGPLAVDYRVPRGVAISLDYAKAPHRGLMGVMKGPGGYTYPGLVHLKLGLADTDGVNGKAPKTSGPPGLGYHSDFRPFGQALARFVGPAVPRPSLLDVGWLPPLREDSREGRFPGVEPDVSPSGAAAPAARMNAVVGRLQAVAIQDPQRAQQAIESEPSGPAVEGTDEIQQVAPARAGHAAMQAEIGMDLGQPAPAPLNDGDLARVKRALGGEGLALRRMNERAARAKGVVARMGLNAPRPLEGRRRADFAMLVERDIASLAASTDIERQVAANLLLRAVDSGQMGARLRPDDKLLLLEILAQAKA